MAAGVRIGIATLGLLLSTAAFADPGRSDDKTPDRSPEARANATLEKMSIDEKVVLTHGVMALPLPPTYKIPEGAVLGAGYVAGVPRLGVPPLTETDASLGVAYVMGLRGDGATALPSAMAMASTWDPDLVRRGGAMIGGEARAKGFNVMLAGGVNLMRDPRNGRTFEYLGEDPLLAGTLAGAAINGIQSNHVISTIKHFALNGQETGRKFVDVRISENAARESDLLAFQIGIETGKPGAVMCAYNRINGANACENDWLLNKVLKRDWDYKGFVMSDWGAVSSMSSAGNGLDQQSGAQLDPKLFFGDALKEAAAREPALATRLDDMNRRVLTSIYAVGLDLDPAKPGGTIDFVRNGDVAEEVAKQSIVLLRNQNAALPLAKSAKRIAIIGGYADVGVLSGGGSSQVQGKGGPAVFLNSGGDGPFAKFVGESYQRSAPIKAIRAKAPGAEVIYRNGRYIADAVKQARKADVAIIFATQWTSEGFDVPDLSLPNGQDELIAAVAAANPHTIVVLENGGPVLMPWLDKTAAVIEAWYPGARGGEAIASVLFGDTNPGGRLPVTFPASLDQLPRPKLDGSDTIEPDFSGAGQPGDKLSTNYDIEGSDLGYRWNARKGYKALFPFGFGLSYTSFQTGDLRTDGKTARLSVANSGAVPGDTVAQLYLVSRDATPRKRLVGYRRVSLAPGEKKAITLTIDPRLLADWSDGQWVIPAGAYDFALGDNAEELGARVTVRIKEHRWKQ
jgi:beta-glucosidase